MSPTVLAGVIRGADILILMVFVVLHFLDDLIEEVIEKLVRVLVHRAAEEFIAITELLDKGTRCNGAFIRRIPRNVHIKRTEGGEEGRRR